MNRIRSRDNSNQLFEILSVKEAADFLKVSTKTVYKEARFGGLPHKRIGSKYVFLRSELVKYVKGD